ncbi:hypothetical protein R1flu_012838 [Riccia fluitans]|uniref:Phospholipase D n=1 Tax=Riccia fluitans TaxID=41844 RepID=A0ABD1ZBW8_9MARC
MANYLVHGTLHVTIYEASGLVDSDRTSGAAPWMIRKLVEGLEDTVGLGRGSSRLYATVDLGKTRVGRTRIIEREPVSPIWNESFRIYAAHTVSDVIITVKNDNTIGASLVGRAKVPVTEVLSGRNIDDWFDLFMDNGERCKGGEARVRFKMRYFAAVDDIHWGRGIGSPRYDGVPYTFFPQRRGCRVKLYQDAHMNNNWLPQIYLTGQGVREATRCWEDAYSMIIGARYLIYITGWSVYTKIRLIRDEDRMIEGAKDILLGELLKRKADQGVRVNLLVWDDRTSVGAVKPVGVMNTHDEETFVYFQNTNVKCVLAPRNPDSGLSIVQAGQIGMMFTHHQKTIMVDAPLPGGDASGPRRIISMVGGLDLCNGRFDTPGHPLFSSLTDVHCDDFYQPCFPTGAIECGGPREPWHDIHAQVEGAVAWDILYNFEQRWRRQAGKDAQQRLFSLRDEHDMIPPHPVLAEDDPESWNVQVFRSIDNGAVHFPSDPDDAAKCGLVSGKDNVIDRSIQDAYINAIRRARDFIYIENQYFLGSAFGWDHKRDAGAFHLIPMELALKIVSKIEAGERFAVYIVVPMWPEGEPEGQAVQAILDWQHETMQMMYKMIAQALEDMGSHESPKDYLNFYCLGNREPVQADEFKQVNKPLAGTNYQRAQDARRFMIYVHSKMMIVDDEYIILGSANINERSMNGARDTEIAIGAYQPQRLAGPQGLPHGQVHGFRMSLWYEHLGRLDNSFLQPQSVECVQLVNAVADECWTAFTQERPCRMPGHLLHYPVDINAEGEVTSLHDFKFFPDTNASVLGSQTTATLTGFVQMPSILTT